MGHRRRQFREMETLEVAIRQGAIIPCKRCRVALSLEDVTTGNVQKEHLHELSLGGKDQPDNCAFSHCDCHKVVTNGNGATTAGSSQNRNAKANHANRTEKFKVNKTPLTADAVGDLPQKCRGCGEMTEDCICPPSPPRRSAFDRVRR
jgi:hypothetical protein